MDKQIDPEIDFIKATLTLIEHYENSDDPSELTVKELENILNSITTRIFHQKNGSKSLQ